MALPPNRFDHTGAPAALYFARKTSLCEPLAVSGPLPKLAVPVKLPVMTMLPPPSTATA
jgi:hypothetical protein